MKTRFAHVASGRPVQLSAEAILDLQEQILAFIQTTFDQILLDLETRETFRQLDPGDRFREFKAQTDGSPVGPFLIAAYSGKLSIQYVQRYVRKPREVLSIARKIKIIPSVGDEAGV